MALIAALIPATSFYLPSPPAPSPYCLDPDSPALREAFTRAPLQPSSLVDASAMADDLIFLKTLARRTYSGWPQIVQAQQDVAGSIDARAAALRARGGKVTLDESLLEVISEMKTAVLDQHLWAEGWAASAHAARLKFSEYQAVASSALDLSACQTSTTGARLDTLTVRPRIRRDGSRDTVVTISARDAGETLELVCGREKLRLLKRPAPAQKSSSTGDLYSYVEAGDAGGVDLILSIG